LKSVDAVAKDIGSLERRTRGAGGAFHGVHSEKGNGSVAFGTDTIFGETVDGGFQLPRIDGGMAMRADETGGVCKHGESLNTVIIYSFLRSTRTLHQEEQFKVEDI
jgi:hypothetical protein